MNAQTSLGVCHPNDCFAIKRLSKRSLVNSGLLDFEQRGLRQVGGIMRAKSIIVASLWKFLMVAAKHRRRERAERAPKEPPPTLRRALWVCLHTTAPWACHAEVSGICDGSRQPFCGDGHAYPRQILDTGVMNGNFLAQLLAFDEDDEVFFRPHWMAFSNRGWAGQTRRPCRRGDRQFRHGTSSGSGIRLAEIN